MHPVQISRCSIGAPEFDEPTVSRAALHHRLDALAPITVIQGLMGSGKTTLAAEWARRRHSMGDVVYWLSAADVRPYEGIVAKLTGGAGDHRRTIVVIDDAQYFTAPAVIDALVVAVARSPWLHVVICARAVHPLARSAEQAGVRVSVLSGRHLSVTADELPMFAECWGHTITPDRARHLRRELGGWLGVLRHALDHADPQYDPDGLHDAVRYLREEIVPQTIRGNTLLAAMAAAATGHVVVSLLSRVFAADGPLHHVSGPFSAAEVTEEISRRGILEAVHTEGETFWRFPRMLETALTAALERDHPDIARYVHITSATWFAERLAVEGERLAGPASVHARACEDWGLLARIWNEHGVSLTINHPRQASAAYDDLPDGAVAAYPELALAASVISSLDTSLEDGPGRSLVNNYQQAGWVIHALPLPPESPRLLETTAHMIAARHCGDVREAMRIAARYATAYLQPRGSRTSVLHRAWFELQWGITAFAAADGPRAVQLLVSAAHDARVVGAHVIVSVATAQLALMNAVGGYTRTASDFLAEHEEVRAENQWLQHSATAAARVTEAILLLDRLDPTASDLLDVAGVEGVDEWAIIAWVRTTHALLFDAPILAMTEVNRLALLRRGALRAGNSDRIIIDRCLADLYLALGELNRAHRHLQAAGTHQTALAVPRARLAFICADYATTRRIAAIHTWDATTTFRDRIDLLFLKAASSYRMGDIDTARSLMGNTVRLAAQADTLLPYTAFPRDLRNELLALVDHGLSEEDLALIDAHPRPFPEKGELISLSRRETVVLQELIEHETLAEVADALVVSLNTVKKQVQAVYGKLGVHDRKAALLKAQRLGLISEEL